MRQWGLPWEWDRIPWEGLHDPGTMGWVRSKEEIVQD